MLFRSIAAELDDFPDENGIRKRFDSWGGKVVTLFDSWGDRVVTLDVRRSTVAAAAPELLVIVRGYPFHLLYMRRCG